MQTLRGILIKTCSKTMQRIYTRVSLQGRSLINSMHAPSTTPLIALPCFHLLNCKRLLQVVWIPQWYFVTYATRSINIGTFKMFICCFIKNKPNHSYFWRIFLKISRTHFTECIWVTASCNYIVRTVLQRYSKTLIYIWTCFYYVRHYKCAENKLWCSYNIHNKS